ncbi:MAG: 50S ribosomal protein L22 [Methanobacteriota archaeon]|nr:MAG: 50S ribosomal protein L22 [Euryarchaeota archaeon]
MSKIGYSAQDLDDETTARAIGRELPISPKKAVEMCRAIRGKSVEDAKEYLEEVIALTRAVPMKRYKMMVGHKAGIGPGRYPVKVARHFLKVLQTAEENAGYKGLDVDNMRIKVLAAHKGATTKGFMPRAHGRSSPWNQETVNLEVVLEEVE